MRKKFAIGIGASLLVALATPTTLAQTWVPQGPPLKAIATLAEWGDLATVNDPAATELRVTNWNPLGSGPSAVLRLVVMNGRVQPSSVIWWGPYLSPQHALTGPGVRCDDPKGALRMCIQSLPVQIEHDWEKLAGDLLSVGPFQLPETSRQLRRDHLRPATVVH